MNEREELNHELDKELRWVKYRQKVLDIIEEKLLQMKMMAEEAKEIKLSSEELKKLNDKLNILVSQVNKLDNESKSLKNVNENILK